MKASNALPLVGPEPTFEENLALATSLLAKGIKLTGSTVTHFNGRRIPIGRWFLNQKNRPQTKNLTFFDTERIQAINQLIRESDALPMPKAQKNKK
jgi:hypothetical protein